MSQNPLSLASHTSPAIALTVRHCFNACPVFPLPPSCTLRHAPVLYVINIPRTSVNVAVRKKSFKEASRPREKISTSTRLGRDLIVTDENITTHEPIFRRSAWNLSFDTYISGPDLYGFPPTQPFTLNVDDSGCVVTSDGEAIFARVGWPGSRTLRRGHL